MGRRRGAISVSLTAEKSNFARLPLLFLYDLTRESSILMQELRGRRAWRGLLLRRVLVVQLPQRPVECRSRIREAHQRTSCSLKIALMFLFACNTATTCKGLVPGR